MTRRHRAARLSPLALLCALLLAPSPAAALQGGAKPAPAPAAASPSKPTPPALPKVLTSTPAETLASFSAAMDDVRRGRKPKNPALFSRIDDALHTLDLSELPAIARESQGRKAAVFIKEVVDRLGSLAGLAAPDDPKLLRWQVAGSVLTLRRMDKGPRLGEFLFSARSVALAERLYLRVQGRPYAAGSGGGAGYSPESSEAAERLRSAAGQELKLIKTDNPRDTMHTFLAAMNDYRSGLKGLDDQGKVIPDSERSKLEKRLAAARACLDLTAVSTLLREEVGAESAVLLKEVIDRLVFIDFDKIPELNDDGSPLERWRLRGTNIAIARVSEGERHGEYLFSPDTVRHVRSMYEQVAAFPYVEGTGGGALYEKPWLERHVPEWSRQKLLLFPNWQWIGLFLVILIGFFGRGFSSWLIGGIARLAERSKTPWDQKLAEAVKRPLSLVAGSALWWFGVQLLRFEGRPLAVLTAVVEVVFSLALIWTFYKLSDVLTEYLSKLAMHTDNTLDDHLVPLFKRAVHTFIVVFGVLVSVQNLGFNVVSLLAGLGLGGLAFALAARDTCANLFGSMMILADRPFQVGDWIISGSVEGTVESIGFRSTRVRTFYNSLISVPNSTLASANIDNMGMRKKRRIKAFFGLAYDTPPERVEAFIEGVRQIIKANPHTNKEAFHVAFSGYGASSLDIMLYCFLEVANWSGELVQRQNIYLEILRLAKTLGVEFAFPTQTLHVDSMPKDTAPEDRPVAPSELSNMARSFGPRGERARPEGLGIFVPPERDPELVAIARGDSDIADDDG